MGISSVNILNPKVLLFAIARNEELRLPYFLEYYRKLGVDHFYIVNNDSKDNTLNILNSQKDVTVVTATSSYRDACFGVNWVKSLLNIFNNNNWCLVVDIDELFCFKGSENKTIGEFCRELDERGKTSVFSILVDMYSDKPIRDAIYRQGDDFLSTCNYFDGDPFSYFKGGVRNRFFDIGADMKKYPLIKYSQEMNLYTGYHLLTGSKQSEKTGCLLHFKFFSDFIEKVNEEVVRNEHWFDSFEYRHYAKEMKNQPNLSLLNSTSVQFKNTDQLCELNLMKG